MRPCLRYAPLLIGLVVGLALGLVYSWVVDPVKLTNAYPAVLRSDHRDEWVRLAALSYVVDGDLDRARARLEGLERGDVGRALTALIEAYAAGGRSSDTLRRLTTLAEAVDVKTPAMSIYAAVTVSAPPTRTPTDEPSTTPTSTRTPSPTPVHTVTPSPTRTPSATLTPSPTPPFVRRLRLVEKEPLCEREQEPHIEVVVLDETGEGVPGIEVWLRWSDGADRAMTGLKPGRGPGYVDFRAAPDVTYTVSVVESGMPLVTGLRLEDCSVEEDGEPFAGSWRLVLAP